MDNGGERKRMPRLVGGSGLEDANSPSTRVASHESRGRGAEGGIRPMRPMNAETAETAKAAESTARFFGSILSDTCRGRCSPVQAISCPNWDPSGLCRHSED